MNKSLLRRDRPCFQVVRSAVKQAQSKPAKMASTKAKPEVRIQLQFQVSSGCVGIVLDVVDMAKHPAALHQHSRISRAYFSGRSSWNSPRVLCCYNSIERRVAAVLFPVRTGPGSPALMSVFITHTHIFTHVRIAHALRTAASCSSILCSAIAGAWN